MMSVLLEGALDEELDEELGYSKYDYRNKETDNSRNGHSSKTMHTSYGDMDVAIPRDRNGDYEPQLIKKYQNTVTLQGAMPLSQLFEVLFDSSVVVKYPIF
jgi:putative transposase